MDSFQFAWSSEVVDQKPVATPQEVTEIVAKLQAQKKRSVLLFVERQGDPRFAALRLTK